MKYFVAIFVTAVIVFLGATIYYKGLPTFPIYLRSPFATTSGIPAGGSETATPVPTPTATPDENAQIISDIKAGLIAKHGPDFSDDIVTVSKVEGNYAKGMVNSPTGGGGIWFGAKVNGKWTLVWDGNGIILCSDISSFPAFPKDLIPECFDSTTQKLITR